MSWHNLGLWANRTGEIIVVGCDECENWEKKLPLADEIDGVVSVSYLAGLEDDHNEDMRQ